MGGAHRRHRRGADGDADLYFGLWWVTSTAPAGVVVDEVLNERAWVLLPADHPCATEPAVSLRSLARETWVSRPEPELYRSLLTDCRRAGFESNVQFRVVDEATLLSVVGAGAGVASLAPSPTPVARWWRGPVPTPRATPGSSPTTPTASRRG